VASPDTLEIRIFDEIGQSMWSSDGITAKSIDRAIQAAPDSVTRLMLLISSPGGDICEGLACFSLLKSCGLEVHGKVLGLAASSASVLAMAASHLSIGMSSLMFLHESWCATTGFSEDFRKSAATLEKLNDSMAKCYSAKSGMSQGAARKLMSEESWLSDTDCLTLNLVDNISTDEQDEQNAEDARAMVSESKLMAFYARVPESLRPRR
jgi:ATP-dependent protease ClpP protease subunit